VDKGTKLQPILVEKAAYLWFFKAYAAFSVVDELFSLVA
jgi:hypothetical protein